jgi:ribA/ribD-fused uncharacterized protein
MIIEFKGDYRFLSNFYIEPDGTHVEGEYQAAKCEASKNLFAGLTPGQAKKLGKSIRCDPGWEDRKLKVMSDLVCQKFHDHPGLQVLLLETQPQVIMEGNRWHDNFWGNCTCVDCINVCGRNYLGQILMNVRTYFNEQRISKKD